MLKLCYVRPKLSNRETLDPEISGKLEYLAIYVRTSMAVYPESLYEPM